MAKANPGEGPQRLCIQLLGRFEVRVDGRALHLAAAQQRLVSFLALADRPLRREHVAGALWPDGREERAMANLRATLWRLRPECDVVSATPTTVRVSEDVPVDVRDLVRLATLERDEDPVPDGELLPGWDEEWVASERERLRQLRLHALEARSGRLLRAGRAGAALDLARRAVAADPARESAQRALIAAYLADGNRSAALRQYRTYRTRLTSEFGVEPSPAMTELVAPLAVAAASGRGA